ncbi:hypothetical protein KM043_001483 [Ampulex compressa]|nr:hypothetical protein KM043_001483 [Ampulex compressa]
MWVFGYGSLIWKADFPYEKTVVGHIKGYRRRFYQKSTDHRGVPSRPGRVVTLLSSPNPDEEVWGIAYKISSTHVDSVVKHLDFREKGGYMRRTVIFHPRNTSENIASICTEENNSKNIRPTADPSVSVTLDAQTQDSFYITIYIGEPNNPNYAGAEDISTIANHIFLSHGPSGSNIEYLYKLASAMRAIAPGVYDEHLFTLEAAVKELERQKDKETTNMNKHPHSASY